MHKRRVSEDLYSSSSTRKKLSTQFIDRQTLTPDQFFNKTSKFSSNLIKIHPVPTDSSIASIIQTKVANLKHKFGELDNMRKRLIDSRCESREEIDSKLSTMNHSRARSGDSSCETYTQDLYKTKPDLMFSQTYSKEKFEIELHNERKSTQKAILDKSLAERENQEKIKQLGQLVQSMRVENEKGSEKLKICEKRLADCEETRKKQENLIESQASEIKNLSQQLICANKNVKEMSKQIGGLEQSLRSLRESTSTSAVKKLSNIILSKDSPTKSESQNSQVVNKYMETLQDLQSSYQFLLDSIRDLERNNFRKVQQELLAVKGEMVKKMQKANWNMEELERYFYDCRSPSPQNRSSLVEFIESTSEPELDKLDLLSWVKCQAAVVEDLLLLSDTTK